MRGFEKGNPHCQDQHDCPRGVLNRGALDRAEGIPPADVAAQAQHDLVVPLEQEQRLLDNSLLICRAQAQVVVNLLVILAIESVHREHLHAALALLQLQRFCSHLLEDRTAPRDECHVKVVGVTQQEQRFLPLNPLQHFHVLLNGFRLCQFCPPVVPKVELQIRLVGLCPPQLFEVRPDLLDHGVILPCLHGELHLAHHKVEPSDALCPQLPVGEGDANLEHGDGVGFSMRLLRGLGDPRSESLLPHRARLATKLFSSPRTGGAST
mmetsp:Transcript_7812/g.19533  ORF Transcript_7812/g.19533 Transcript_7812/m.19533 type:complete len:266 (-) Transcript_7812:111-908(-)